MLTRLRSYFLTIICSFCLSLLRSDVLYYPDVLDCLFFDFLGVLYLLYFLYVLLFVFLGCLFSLNSRTFFLMCRLLICMHFLCSYDLMLVSVLLFLSSIVLFSYFLIFMSHFPFFCFCFVSCTWLRVLCSVSLISCPSFYFSVLWLMS